MTFIWPGMLYSLVLIPLLVVLYVRIQQRRRKFATDFGSLWSTQAASSGAPAWRRHVPPTFFMASLAILLFALARPEAVVTLPRVEGTVILAFDVSDSMAATDIQPSRLEAAKAAAREFVQQQPPSMQIGVIAFSDSGFSVQLPSNDQGAILAAINRLAPTRGTSLATGIYAALNTIASQNALPTPQYYSNVTPQPSPTPTAVPPGTYTSAAIVLLTDGENNLAPDPLNAAQSAADRGVRIYTVGLGSPSGADLQVDGFTIHTQLDEGLLKQISSITGGTYYNAESAQDLLAVYHKLESQLVIKPQRTEVTSILAGAGIFILLVGSAFSLLWFGRLV